MNGTDRAGRRKQIVRVLYQYWKRGNMGSMTTGQVARRIGMKSSTHLKSILRELVQTNDNIMEDGTRDVFAVLYRPFQQQPLPDRFITINGKQHKVANWVLDQQEVQSYA